MVHSSSLFDYTSPPTDIALAATPFKFRSDKIINEIRSLDATGQCNAAEAATNKSKSSDEKNEYGKNSLCQIPFLPLTTTAKASSLSSSTVGIVLYGGGLVDPRSYAPLARILADRYRFPVVVPVFYGDIHDHNGNRCQPSGRVAMAHEQFPHIKNWVLVGHSFGTLTATIDAWTAMTPSTSVDEESNSIIAGLVLLAGYVPDGCGDTDFSNSTLIPPEFPMALVYATNDHIMNKTHFFENMYLVSNNTIFVPLVGGNHQQFGSYNTSDRVRVLGKHQIDGVATISPQSQWNICAKVIYDIALQSKRINRNGSSLMVQPSTTDPTRDAYDNDRDFVLYETMVSTTVSSSSSFKKEVASRTSLSSSPGESNFVPLMWFTFLIFFTSYLRRRGRRNEIMGLYRRIE